MAEIGYTDIEGENWQAVLVPAGTPKEVITLLNQEVIKIVMLPESRSAWQCSASSRLPIRPVRALSKSGRKLPNGPKLSEQPTSRRSEFHPACQGFKCSWRATRLRSYPRAEPPAPPGRSRANV